MVPFVRRIHCHGRIAQHRLRAGGRHAQVALAVLKGIANVPEVSRTVFVHDFQIRYCRAAARAPVDDILPAIDQAFLVEPYEHFQHGASVGRVQREAVTRPVHGGAEPLHLAADGATILLLPFPAALQEFIQSHFAPEALTFALPGAPRRRALQIGQGLPPQFALHNHLRGDGGVIRTGQPQDVFAAHAMPAHQDVDFRVLQHVAHVERPRDIRRRNDQAERRAATFIQRAVKILLHPLARPAGFNTLRRINLGDFCFQSHLLLIESGRTLKSN